MPWKNLFPSSFLVPVIELIVHVTELNEVLFLHRLYSPSNGTRFLYYQTVLKGKIRYERLFFHFYTVKYSFPLKKESFSFR